MRSRLATAITLTLLLGASSPVLAVTIPCTVSANTECVTGGTCQANGTCKGEPANEGQSCIHESTSGGCMSNAFCTKGVCKGTVPAADGTDCNFPGLEKCYSPGKCRSIAGTQLSFCTLGTPKACQPPSDPCMLSACNPQTGDCIQGPKCPGVFYGCEVCSAGTCSPVNIGGACANPEGDFNPCTTDDHCALVSTSALSELAPAATAQMPVGLAAAFGEAQQVGQTIAICQGVPGGGGGPTATPTMATTPTPTAGPTLCVGDCDGDGEVTVNELIVMVNIALGNADPSVCIPGDADGSGDIAVNEIVSAVNRALDGCFPVF